MINLLLVNWNSHQNDHDGFANVVRFAVIAVFQALEGLNQVS